MSINTCWPSLEYAGTLLLLLVFLMHVWCCGWFRLFFVFAEMRFGYNCVLMGCPVFLCASGAFAQQVQQNVVLPLNLAPTDLLVRNSLESGPGFHSRVVLDPVSHYAIPASAPVLAPKEIQTFNPSVKNISLWSDNRGSWRLEFPSGIACTLSSSLTHSSDACQ
jgi:hypothetical protein